MQITYQELKSLGKLIQIKGYKYEKCAEYLNAQFHFFDYFKWFDELAIIPDLKLLEKDSNELKKHLESFREWLNIDRDIDSFIKRACVPDGYLFFTDRICLNANDWEKSLSISQGNKISEDKKFSLIDFAKLYNEKSIIENEESAKEALHEFFSSYISPYLESPNLYTQQTLLLFLWQVNEYLNPNDRKILITYIQNTKYEEKKTEFKTINIPYFLQKISKKLDQNDLNKYYSYEKNVLELKKSLFPKTKIVEYLDPNVFYKIPILNWFVEKPKPAQSIEAFLSLLDKEYASTVRFSDYLNKCGALWQDFSYLPHLTISERIACLDIAFKLIEQELKLFQHGIFYCYDKQIDEKAFLPEYHEFKEKHTTLPLLLFNIREQRKILENSGQDNQNSLILKKIEEWQKEKMPIFSIHEGASFFKLKPLISNSEDLITNSIIRNYFKQYISQQIHYSIGKNDKENAPRLFRNILIQDIKEMQRLYNEIFELKKQCKDERKIREYKEIIRDLFTIKKFFLESLIGIKINNDINEIFKADLKIIEDFKEKTSISFLRYYGLHTKAINEENKEKLEKMEKTILDLEDFDLLYLDNKKNKEVVISFLKKYQNSSNEEEQRKTFFFLLKLMGYAGCLDELSRDWLYYFYVNSDVKQLFKYCRGLNYSLINKSTSFNNKTYYSWQLYESTSDIQAAIENILFIIKSVLICKKQNEIKQYFTNNYKKYGLYNIELDRYQQSINKYFKSSHKEKIKVLDSLFKELYLFLTEVLLDKKAELDKTILKKIREDIIKGRVQFNCSYGYVLYSTIDAYLKYNLAISYSEKDVNIIKEAVDKIVGKQLTLQTLKELRKFLKEDKETSFRKVVETILIKNIFSNYAENHRGIADNIDLLYSFIDDAIEEGDITTAALHYETFLSCLNNYKYTPKNWEEKKKEYEEKLISLVDSESKILNLAYLSINSALKKGDISLAQKHYINFFQYLDGKYGKKVFDKETEKRKIFYKQTFQLLYSNMTACTFWTSVTRERNNPDVKIKYNDNEGPDLQSLKLNEL